jgi:hypothetical protein
MESGEQLRRYPRGRGGARVLHRADFLAQCATEAISAFCSEGGSWSGIRCKTTLVVSQKQPLRCSSRLLGRCRPTGDSNTRSTARGPRQRVCARRAARCQRGGALSAQGHRGRGQRQAATGGREESVARDSTAETATLAGKAMKETSVVPVSRSRALMTQRH